MKGKLLMDVEMVQGLFITKREENIVDSGKKIRGMVREKWSIRINKDMKDNG